jgi:hypothetical protein
MSARRYAVAAVSLALACQPKARENGGADTTPAARPPEVAANPNPAPPPDTIRPPAKPSTSTGGGASGQTAKPQGKPSGGTVRPVDPKSGTLPSGTAATVGAATEKEEVRTVRELLSSDRDVGRMVRVSGQCLGYGKPVAEGMPPRSRSDWQLEDGGVAIYVTGPLPAGCSATAGATERTTIVARVAQDTMPAMGNREATPRRYLVVERR